MTKILLVEDDKSLREIYGVRLLAEGYDIVSAGDGEEALAMAIKERPQLIVSDVMMPKISGFDMLDILRSTTETKDIKVIMMTALSSEDQRERGESLGADRYLVKSQVGIEDVVRTVHEVLGDTPAASTIGVNAFAPSAPAPRPAPVVPGRPDAGTAVPPRATSTPTPTPMPTPTPPMQTPMVAPSMPSPQSAPVSPVPAPITPPQTTPAIPAPDPTATAPATDQASALPQPTAPFSTNRPGNLGDRVIHPIDQPASNKPDLSDLMAEELGNDASSSATPSTPAVPAPPVPPVPNLNFEETPLSSKPTDTSSQ